MELLQGLYPLGYSGGTVSSPSFNDEIVEILNDSSYAHVRLTIVDTDEDSWFIQALEVNDDTVELVDLIKYIFNEANGDEQESDWDSVWSGLYKDLTEVSTESILEKIREYIRSFEGSGTISDDGTMYQVYVGKDGDRTVGYGVNLDAHSSYDAALLEAGYNTSERWMVFGGDGR